MNAQLNKEHNTQAIKRLLDEGKILTVAFVYKVVKTLELRHYVAILRKEFKIRDRWVKKNGKRFKEYFL